MFGCFSKPQLKVENVMPTIRTSSKMDPLKKLIIFQLEGALTYQGLSILNLKQKKNSKNSLQESYTKQKSLFKLNNFEDNNQSTELLKILIPNKTSLNQNKDYETYLMIRPFMLQFIEKVSVRYNILILTKLQKPVNNLSLNFSLTLKVWKRSSQIIGS